MERRPAPHAGQAGFTLVEVLVATALALFLMAGAVSVFTSAITSQPDLSKKGADIQTARTTMERIIREVRLGSSVPVATSTQLSIVTYVNSATCGGAVGATKIPCRVTYTCASGSCTRVEASPTGASPGPASTVVTGLSSSNVFTYSPSSSAPTYITLTLAFPGARGDDAITLRDATGLRNNFSS